MRHTWQLYVFLGVFAVVPALVAHWRVSARGREFDLKADALLLQAKQQKAAPMNYRDARAWLEDHGFQVIAFGSNWIAQRNGGTESCVVGIKSIGWESTMKNDRWIEISFIFDSSMKFRGVELTNPSQPPPRWNTITTRTAH
jgi:hypothetical protein